MRLVRTDLGHELTLEDDASNYSFDRRKVDAAVHKVLLALAPEYL